MGVDIYLQLGGFTDDDFRRRLADVDGWADPFAMGQFGHLEGWRWQNLFFETFRNSETPESWTVIPGETLMRRLPAVIEAITADHDGPDDPYWHHYLGQAAGFVHRVVQLEVEGLNMGPPGGQAWTVVPCPGSGSALRAPCRGGRSKSVTWTGWCSEWLRQGERAACPRPVRPRAADWPILIPWPGFSKRARSNTRAQETRRALTRRRGRASAIPAHAIA